MIDYLSIFTLIPSAILFSFHVKRTLAFSLLFAISTTVLILYLGGFFLPLSILKGCIQGLLAAYIIYSVYDLGLKLIKTKIEIFKFEILFIFALLCFLFFRYHGATFEFWDELSSWGTMWKELIFYNRNLSLGDTMYISTYPPGSALFQFFFTNTSNIQEGAAYFAQNLILCLPLICLFEKAKNRYNALLYIIFSTALLSCLFEAGWKSLYVDALLPSLFFVLYAEVDSKQISKIDFALIFLGAGLIAIVKKASLFFVLLFVATKFTSAKRLSRSPLTQNILLILALPVGWFLQLLWANEAFQRTLPPAVDKPSRFLDFYNNGPTEIQNQVLKNFTKALSNEHLVNLSFSSRLDIFGLTIILVIFYCFFHFLKKNRQASKDLIIFFMGAVTYLCGLLNLYLFHFNDYEAINLASFVRYINSFVYLVFICLFLLILKNIGNWTTRFFAIVFALFFFDSANTKKTSTTFAKTPPSEHRLKIQKLTSTTIEKTSKESLVYLIYPNTKGFEFFTSRYELLPRKTNSECWSLGKKYYEGDVWTCELSEIELTKTLNNYDYILFLNWDPLILNSYSIFKDLRVQENQSKLLKIIKERGTLLRLEEI